MTQAALDEAHRVDRNDEVKAAVGAGVQSGGMKKMMLFLMLLWQRDGMVVRKQEMIPRRSYWSWWPWSKLTRVSSEVQRQQRP